MLRTKHDSDPRVTELIIGGSAVAVQTYGSAAAARHERKQEYGIASRFQLAQSLSGAGPGPQRRTRVTSPLYKE